MYVELYFSHAIVWAVLFWLSIALQTHIAINFIIMIPCSLESDHKILVLHFRSLDYFAYVHFKPWDRQRAVDMRPVAMPSAGLKHTISAHTDEDSAYGDSDALWRKAFISIF